MGCVIHPLIRWVRPKRKYFLRGSLVDGFYAPDITGEGLKQVTLDRLVKAFKQGDSIYGSGHLVGPMEEVNHNSLRYLTNADLYAMATYLKSVQSAKKRASKHHPGKKGKAIYEDKCAVCHDTGAAGAPKFGDASDWNARMQQQGLKQLYHNAIHGINGMPARGSCLSCTDREIKLTVDYLVANAKKSSKKKGKSPEPTSFARGKRVYAQYCADCHEKGPLKLGDKQAWAPKLAQGLPALISQTLDHHRPVKGVNRDGDWIAAIKYLAEHAKKAWSYRLW